MGAGKKRKGKKTEPEFLGGLREEKIGSWT
jgi:hypothetical protein